MFGKETKELIHAIAKVAGLIVEKAQDGLTRDEILEVAGKLVMEAAFRDAVVAAIVGAQKIPGEIGNLKISEVLKKIESATSPV